mmetsp:Transcript_20611/g.42776  ORF Transcript_20611/g.42776 Transcript_20611/m.42776 type:complete len:118 (+) Transcript_20611:284-637(+)
MWTAQATGKGIIQGAQASCRRSGKDGGTGPPALLGIPDCWRTGPRGEDPLAGCGLLQRELSLSAVVLLARGVLPLALLPALPPGARSPSTEFGRGRGRSFCCARCCSRSERLDTPAP